jgi:hypothetical protein
LLLAYDMLVILAELCKSLPALKRLVCEALLPEPLGTSGGLFSPVSRCGLEKR